MSPPPPFAASYRVALVEGGDERGDAREAPPRALGHGGRPISAAVSCIHSGRTWLGGTPVWVAIDEHKRGDAGRRGSPEPHGFRAPSLPNSAMAGRSRFGIDVNDLQHRDAGRPLQMVRRAAPRTGMVEKTLGAADATGAGAAGGVRVEQGAALVSMWAGEAERRRGLGTGGSNSDGGHQERCNGGGHGGRVS
jgi:hypothetical protein